MSELETSRSEIKPRAEDIASPDAIIKAMYETISGPAGKRNWQRERSLYLPGARLVSVGKRIHGEGGLQALMRLEEMSRREFGFWPGDFESATIHVTGFVEPLDRPLGVRHSPRIRERFQSVPHSPQTQPR